MVCQPKGVRRDCCGERRGHRLSLVERGGRGPGGLPGADPARVLVDQLAVAIPGCAVPAAKGFKRAEGGACALMDRHAVAWMAVERVALRWG